MCEHPPWQQWFPFFALRHADVMLCLRALCGPGVKLPSVIFFSGRPPPPVILDLRLNLHTGNTEGCVRKARMTGALSADLVTQRMYPTRSILVVLWFSVSEITCVEF